MKRLAAAAVLVLLSAVTASGAVQDSGRKLAAMTGLRDSLVAKSSHRRPRVDSFRDSNGNTRLILAAVDGNKNEVRELIEAGASINIRNKCRMSALMTASAALAVVQDFGEYTVDVIDGWTAVRQGETVYFVKNANGQMTDAVIISISGKKFMQWGIAGAETAGKEIERLIDSFTAKKSSANAANTAETVKTLNTKYFTFAVPKGWDGYEIDETSVKVENDNETASMYVEIEDLDGWEPDDLAEFYAKEHKAKDLKEEEITRRKEESS